MRLRAHEGVAATSFRLRDQLPESVEHAAEAAVLARAIGRRDLLGTALASKAVSEAILGRPSASASAAEALALQGESEQQRIMSQPGFAVAVVEFWHDDLDGATARFHALTERALVIGDESSIPYLRVMLGQIECVRGRFDEAIELTEGELEHARQAGQETLGCLPSRCRGLGTGLRRRRGRRSRLGGAVPRARRTHEWCACVVLRDLGARTARARARRLARGDTRCSSRSSGSCAGRACASLARRGASATRSRR